MDDISIKSGTNIWWFYPCNSVVFIKGMSDSALEK